MKKWSKSKIIMNVAAIISTLLSIIFFVVNKFYNIKFIETLAITFFTMAFHLDIRLIIGNIVPRFKDKINTNSRRYKLLNFEKGIYDKINVKKWKDKAPTYEIDEFNIKKKTLEEILVNMCNSENVHMLNIIISYIPLIFIFGFGAPIVFIVTTIFSSMLDLQFVIIQRYNRERIVKVMEKKKSRKMEYKVDINND